MYCACPRLLRGNNANRIQNESEQDRQRRLEVSRQNDALRLNERRQQLQDPQDANKRAQFAPAAMGVNEIRETLNYTPKKMIWIQILHH